MQGNQHQGSLTFAVYDTVGEGGFLYAAALALDDKGLVAGFVVKEQVCIGPFRLGGNALCKAEISFFPLMALDGGGESGSGLLILGVDHHAAGLPVQTMDGIDFAAALGAEQGGKITLRSILREKTRWFETDQKVSVLV